MDSSKSSDLANDVRKLRKLVLEIRESIGLLAEWTDSIVEGLHDMVNIQLNNLSFTTDLVEIRLRGQVQKAVSALPGKLSQIGL